MGAHINETAPRAAAATSGQMHDAGWTDRIDALVERLQSRRPVR